MAKINVEMSCPFCGVIHSVLVEEDHFFRWYNENELIQNAMPELSTTEREQLISRMCPECQEEIFGE